jgi:hypothetical protein
MDNHPDNRRDKAIIAIVGKSVSYDSDGDTITKWHSKDVLQPSEADIDAKVAEYETEWNAQAYARNRADDYPDMGEQFNKIYDDGLTKWKAEMVDPVKTKWPKDNSGPV